MKRLLALCLLSALFWADSSWASGLQVSPTLVTIAADRQSEGLMLSNGEAKPRRAQARVFRWTQQDGQDVLEPARDVVASPAMLTLAPGDSQLLRLVRLMPAPAHQQAYRVVISELPDDSKPDSAGLHFLLEYSIPVFVSPQGLVDPSPALQWTVEDSSEGQRLMVTNTGGSYAQLADLRHTDASGDFRPVAEGLAGYVLPGQRRGWILPKGMNGRTGKFTFRVNGAAAEHAITAPTTSR